MNYFLLALLLNLFTISSVLGQTLDQYQLYFAPGQAVVNLAQLDSINLVAKQYLENSNARITVKTYANDAVGTDEDKRLSGRRAFLVQQCLERAGVPLKHLQITNKIYRANPSSTTCKACAEIKLIPDSNFFFRNVYEAYIADYMLDASGGESQTFWVEPFKEQVLMTKDGVLLYIPANALNTIDSGLVKVDIRFLDSYWKLLLHGLSSWDQEKRALHLQQAVEVTAKQYGKALNLKAGQQVMVVMPANENAETAQLYQKNAQAWQLSTRATWQTLPTYTGNSPCNGEEGALAAFNYGDPPAKPEYLSYEAITEKEDKALESLGIRLDQLASYKVDKRGKPKELSSKQRNIEQQLETERTRLLFAKERKKRKVLAQNEAIKAAYYQELAAYNKARSQYQQNYIGQMDSLQQRRHQKALRCTDYQTKAAELEANYGSTLFQKMKGELQTQAKTTALGYWIESQQLGWMTMAATTSPQNHETVPYRVTTPMSAYKVTAFLLLEETGLIVKGEILDETDIVFWEVPDNSAATLLAVTQHGEDFLVALHPLQTNGVPVELKFENQSLKKLLQEFLGTSGSGF